MLKHYQSDFKSINILLRRYSIPFDLIYRPLVVACENLDANQSLVLRTS